MADSSAAVGIPHLCASQGNRKQRWDNTILPDPDPGTFALPTSHSSPSTGGGTQWVTTKTVELHSNFISMTSCRALNNILIVSVPQFLHVTLMDDGSHYDTR